MKDFTATKYSVTFLEIPEEIQEMFDKDTLRRIPETRYSVTRDGRVFSHLKNIWLIPEYGQYVKVFTKNPKNIHRLVAEAFIPNPESKPQVNHKDGNKHNNNVDNLEWCTAKENMQHAADTGLLPSGEDHFRAVFTNKQVEEIKHMFVAGMSDKEVADAIGAVRVTVSKIRQKTSYAMIAPDLVYPMESPGRQSLSAEDIPEIRRLISEGYSFKAIGRIYGVAGATISSIAKGRTWVNY